MLLVLTISQRTLATEDLYFTDYIERLVPKHSIQEINLRKCSVLFSSTIVKSGYFFIKTICDGILSNQIKQDLKPK